MRRQYVEKSDKIQAKPCETKGAQDGAEEKIAMMSQEETSDENMTMVFRHLQQIASNQKNIHINADTYVDSICFAIYEFNYVMEKVTDKIITPEEAVEEFATQFHELDEKGKQILSTYDPSLNELCNLTNRTQYEINNCKEMSRLAAIKPKQREALANDRAAGCYQVAGKAGGVAVTSGCIGAAGGGTILLSAAGANVAGASAVATCAVEAAATAGAIIAGGAAVATGAALVAGVGALAFGLGVKAVHHLSKRSAVEIQEINQWKATEAHISQLTEQIIQIKGVIDQEKSCLQKVNLRLESIAKQMLLVKDKTTEMVKCKLERQSKEVKNLMDECEKYKKMRLQTKNTINPENSVCTTHTQ